MNIIDAIHLEAIGKADVFRKSESSLLEVIMRVDKFRVWDEKRFPSLHKYCMKVLRLSEANAYTFGGIARKANVIPELKTLIDEEKLHVTNARRIVPILTPQNKAQWLSTASKLSARALQRELVKHFPKEMPEEKIRPVSATRSAVTLGISTTLEENLHRVMDLVARKTRKSPTLEEALELLVEGYLDKHDPVRKAKRVLVARAKPKSAKKRSRRKAVPAAVDHARNLRDEGRCTHRYVDGTRCEETRWTHGHHVVHVANGGLDTLPNIVTLCSAHHRQVHEGPQFY
jgi:hypothetical protein